MSTEEESNVEGEVVHDLALEYVLPIEGKDGWLFLRYFGEMDVMRIFMDDTSIPERTFISWARTMEWRRRWFASKKIPFVTIVVPESYTVYPDMLPDDIKLAASSPYERLWAKLSPELQKEVVFPRQFLINGRSRFETYQKVDSHWTDWGAYLGYRAVMERIRQLVPTVHILKTDEITWTERKTYGSMGPLMTPERHCKVPIPKFEGAYQSQIVENIFNERRDGILTVDTGRPGLPVAMVFRDSFTTAMAVFFEASFSRVIYVTAHSIQYDLVEQLRPDVVIYERGERALFVLPEEPSPSDARAEFGDLRLGTEAAMVAQRSSRTALNENRADEALAHSLVALQSASPDAAGRGRAYVHRAKIYQAMGNLPAAIECLRHACTLEPTAALPALKAADLYTALDQKENALALYQTAAKLEPHIPQYWDSLTSALLLAGDLPAAKNSAEQSLALDDFRIPPYLLLTNILCMQKELAEAQSVAEKAVALDPESQYTLGSLASVYLQQGEWAPALEVLQKATKLYPDAAAGFAQYITMCEGRLNEKAASSVLLQVDIAE